MKLSRLVSSKAFLWSASFLWFLFGVWACSQPEPGKTVTATAGTASLFSIDGQWRAAETFFNFPFPSDLRVSDKGGPDWTGFPNPNKNGLIRNLQAAVVQTKGFPVIPVAYFRFSAAVSTHDFQTYIPASPTGPAFLIDVTKQSEDYGKLFPITLHSFERSMYVPSHLLAVSVYPGVVLKPSRTYAFVIMRSLKDAAGKLLGVSKAFNELKAGLAPTGSVMGDKLNALYKLLWPALSKADVSVEDVAGATVFTTRDVVKELYVMSEEIRKKHQPNIKALKLDPDDGVKHARFCELKGKITMPQFQPGTPPYDKDGLFVLDSKGIPKEQRKLEIPVTITVPKEAMPSGGYPLVLYVHGSGGLDSEVVNRGPQTKKNGPRKKGEGPAFVLAPYGIATVSQAMPVNPQRIKTGNPFAYINFDNPAAFRDTFRQGVMELRLLIDAMLRLRIKPETLKGCDGISLPSGETTYRFSEKKLGATGQSMGGQYVNLLTPVEPRIQLAAPTGAGGFWSYFVYSNRISLFQPNIIRTIISAGENDKLLQVHPALQLLQMVWEPSDPLVYAKRVAQRPLPGFAPRHLFQPLGQKDSFFMEPLFDTMAASYGNQLAGKEIWPGTATRLKRIYGLNKGTFPLVNNRLNEKGIPYTGVAIQFAPDPYTGNGHYVAFNRPDVKTVYSCFFHSFFKTGKASVLEPGKTCPR